MIPYERLCEALDRFNRRGEQPEEATAQAAGAPPPPPSPVPGGADDIAPHEVAAGLTSTADGIAVEPVAEARAVPEVTEVPMTEVPADGAPLMEAPTVAPEEPLDAAAMDAAAVEVAPMEVPPSPAPMDPMAGAAAQESPEVAAYAAPPAAEGVQLAPDYGQSAEALAMHPTAAEIPVEQPSVVVDGGAPPAQPDAGLPPMADESTVVSTIPVEEEQKA